MEMMRKELTTIGQSIEARMDTKLTTYESGQAMVKTTIETQMEQAMRRYGDQVSLMEKRLANLVEDKATETKKVTQEVLTKSLEAVKYDYETIINRLGQQV